MTTVCGKPKRQGDHGPCQRPAGWGTPHAGAGACKLHGGSFPSAVRAAERQRADAEASAVLARLDVPPVVNPYRELQKLAGRAVAWVDTCGANLNRLRADELRYASKLEQEQARSEVAFWERSMSLAASLLTSLAKIGLDERLAAIEESKAQMIAAAFAGALADGDLRGEVAARVRNSFTGRLMVLAAGDPAA